MSKTNSLRKLIASRLRTVCSNVYYRNADKDAMYPHIVYSLKNINLGDLHRDDYSVEIDIWHKIKDGSELTEIEDIADAVEALFDNKNLPQGDILPTFFRDMRITVDDSDKSIEHRLVRILIQNYERL